MPLLFSLPKHRSYLRPQTRLRSVFAHGGYHNDLAVAILVCASYQQHLLVCLMFNLKLIFSYMLEYLLPDYIYKKLKHISHPPPIVRFTAACAAAQTYRQVQSFHKTSKSTDYANQYVLRGGVKVWYNFGNS